MIPIVLSVLLAVTPQQLAPAQGPGRAPSPASSAPVQLQPQWSSSPAFDSVVSAITQIGFAVAQVKSGLDQYRRAAFNEPDGALLQRVDRFRNSCRQLTQTVEAHQPKLCTHCLPTDAQRAVDQYRAYMPTLARMGRECSTRLQRVSASQPADSVPARLRRDVRPVGNKVVEGIRPYEDRLQQVRIVFGWERPPTRTPPAR